MSIAAILAVLIAPILIRWSFILASKPSEDGVTFRPAPTLRAVYPAVLIVSLWGVAFYLDEAWKARFTLQWNDWVGLIGMTALTLTAVLSWPPTVSVSKGGLHWDRLFWRKMISWEEIEAVDSGMENDLVIHGHDGKRYEVSQYTQGRPQLKSIVQRKLQERRAGGPQ